MKTIINQIDETHNIYILKSYTATEPIFKVGYSGNIKRRLNQYYQHNPTIELIDTYYYEDAEDIEKRLHNNFNSTLLNEWYDESTIKQIKGILNNPNKVKQLEDTPIIKAKSEIIDKEIAQEQLIIKAHRKVAEAIATDFISSVNLKIIYGKIFKDLGITTKAKGTLITDNPFLDVKETRTRIDGKLTRGFIILGRKIIYNNNTKKL